MGWRRMSGEWERETTPIERRDGWVRIAGVWERIDTAPERKGDWIREGAEWVRISEVRSEVKPAKVGDHVRMVLPGKKQAKVGKVIDEAGNCWVVLTHGSRIEVNKCYCSRIRASRDTDSQGEAGIYGDGEI